MAERFRDQVNYQPISTSTGAASGIMSLAEKLENFKNFAHSKAVELGTEQAIKRGVVAAEEVQLEKKDGLTQAPTFKEQKFIGGIEIQAYNKTIRNAYLASLDNDNREALAGIASENPDNLIGFNEQVEAYRKAVIQNVDPTVRSAVQVDLDREITNYRTKIQANNVQKNLRESTKALEDNILSLSNYAATDARNGDDKSSAERIMKAFAFLDSGVESGLWDKTTAAKKKREIERNATAQKYLGNIDRLAENDIQSAYNYIDKLTEKVPSGFTPDEWTSTTTEGQQNVNRKLARMNRDRKAILKEKLHFESVERGKMFMDPNIPADPTKGGQDRKDINAAYEDVAATWQSLTPDEEYKKNLDFIQNTGVMPDRIIRNVNASMRSGNVNQVAVFSKLINDISKNPNAANILSDLPSESRSVAKQISDSMETGIDIETAVEIARKNTYGLTESEKESIRLKIRELGKNKEFENMLQVKMNDTWDQHWLGFIDEEPDTSPEMQADFNINFEKFMIQTNGNEKQSGELAWEALQKVWGPTEIGGPSRVEKYAPYVFYGVPGVSWKWISRQFNTDVESMGIDPDQATITIVPESLKDQPKWYVMYLDKSGQMQIMTGPNGNPMMWKPDFKESPEYHKYRRTIGEKVNTARAVRQKIESLEDVMRRDDLELTKVREK